MSGALALFWMELKADNIIAAHRNRKGRTGLVDSGNADDVLCRGTEYERVIEIKGLSITRRKGFVIAEDFNGVPADMPS